MLVQACEAASGAIRFYMVSFIIPFVTDLCLSFELLSESFHYILRADPSAPTALVYCLTQYEPCDALELCGKLCHFHPENQLIT